MGLNPKTDHGGFTFVGIQGGEIRVRAKEGDEGAVKRDKMKEGQVVGVSYFLVSESLDGYITGISLEFAEKIKSDVVNIDIIDPDEPNKKYRLSMSLKSLYFGDFVERLRHDGMNFGDQVRIKPFDSEGDDGKKHGLVCLYQNSSPVNFDWANLVQKKFTAKDRDPGQPKYPGKSDTDELDLWKIAMKKYHKKVITEEIIPKVVPYTPEAGGVIPQADNNTSQPSSDLPPAEETDDLPF